ncbi:hypothetical protein ACFV4P_34240 [Kitasatospora sp. NPDC059795]|uniref:hypothetical protein n=1 Tax=Kitasatospora sp. NPDC059795 TaxID=3346949 RepID=UPI003669EC20
MKTRITRQLATLSGVVTIASTMALLPAANANAANFPYPDRAYDHGGFYFNQHLDGILTSGAVACTDNYEFALQKDGNIVL